MKRIDLAIELAKKFNSEKGGVESNVVLWSDGQINCIVPSHKIEVCPSKLHQTTLLFNGKAFVECSLEQAMVIRSFLGERDKFDLKSIYCDHFMLCHADGSLHEDGCDKIAIPEMLKMYNELEHK
jgi:hypothetical protein